MRRLALAVLLLLLLVSSFRLFSAFYFLSGHGHYAVLPLFVFSFRRLELYKWCFGMLPGWHAKP